MNSYAPEVLDDLHRSHIEQYPVPAFQTEALLGNWLLPQLAQHFEIHREVTGDLDGKRLRLDAVLTPKDPSGWKDGADTALGLELKRGHGSVKEYTKHVAQCIDYTYVHWRGFGRLPIFACPSPFDPGIGPDDRDFFLKHLLGQFRIGELLWTRWHGWAFYINGHHRQWSQHGGVEEAARTRLRPKAGAR